MLLAADMRNEAGVFQPDSPMAGKLRTESSSSTDSISTGEVNRAIRTLELERVKEIFQGYDLIEASGAVACVVCGKTYKSKVCVKKHLWEHSVYWDLFDGMKKQQRVLSIQAALILAIKFNPSLSILVVTQSSNNIKKNKTEKFENSEKSVTNTNKSSLQQTVINNNVFKDNIHPSRKRKIGDMVTEDKKQFKKYNQMISNCTVESSYINSDVPTVLPNQ